jgi:hypothetical protein
MDTRLKEFERPRRDFGCAIDRLFGQLCRLAPDRRVYRLFDQIRLTIDPETTAAPGSAARGVDAPATDKQAGKL